MPFVSIFEQEILDQKQEVLKQKQEVLKKDQEILKKDQQARETCLEGIALGLKLKFPAAGEALLAEVQKQTDLDWLCRFLTRIEPAGSVEELRHLLP